MTTCSVSAFQKFSLQRNAVIFALQGCIHNGEVHLDMKKTRCTVPGVGVGVG